MVGFGDRLKRIRVDRGLSQTQLASRLGVSKSLISAYETGMRLPSYDILIALANTFSISTDFLLNIDHRANGEKVDLSGLTSEEIKALKILVQTMKRHHA